MGSPFVIKRHRASRKRYKRPRLATLLALLVGLSVAWSAFELASRGSRVEASLKRGFPAVPTTPREATSGRRGLQRLALGAYLVGASIALIPVGARAGARFDLTSHAPIGICQSTAEVPVPLREMRTEVGRTPVMSPVVAHNSRLVASQPPTPEPEVAKMPPVAKVTANPTAESPAYQADGRPSAGTRGIATWYGVTDGFGPEDTMADGSPFNPYDPTITASNSWPLGTLLRVCHGERCIPVRVRDRGNFRHALDLSMAAFAMLAPLSSGVIEVTIEVTP